MRVSHGPKALVMVLALLAAPLTCQAQSAAKGQASYVHNGCWQCHGLVGQGGVAGPKLAPETKPLEYIVAFLRNTKGAMPPYPEQILSNAELADIHAYLLTIPKGPDYKSIPLLN